MEKIVLLEKMSTGFDSDHPDESVVDLDERVWVLFRCISMEEAVGRGLCVQLYITSREFVLQLKSM